MLEIDASDLVKRGILSQSEPVQFLKLGQYVDDEVLYVSSLSTEEAVLFNREQLAALWVSKLDKSFIKWVVDAGQRDADWSCIKVTLERGNACGDDYTLED